LPLLTLMVLIVAFEARSRPPGTLGNCQFMGMVWTKSMMTVASSASVISGFNAMARLPAWSILQISRTLIGAPLQFA
jgi:hypothetical protein